MPDRTVLRLACVALLSLVFGGMLVAQPSRAEDLTRSSAEEADPAIRDGSRDAEELASAYGLTLTEAVFQLDMQHLFGDIGASIAAEQSDTYAGRWLDRSPTFGVHIAFTSAAPEGLESYFEGTNIAPFVEVHQVDWTLDELEATRDAIDDLLSGLALVSIDERANAVVVNTGDPSGVRTELADRGFRIDTIRFEPAVEAHPAYNVYGGRFLRTCTSGFSVHSNSLDEDGITTARHCSNNQLWSPTGQSLQFVAQIGSAQHDEQWHTAPGNAALKNWVLESSTDYRLIAAKKGYYNQNLGDWVCHYGPNTGYGCGDIVNKYGPNCSDAPGADHGLGIRVSSPTGVDMVDSGDSGGPWYSGQTAHGTSTCEYGTDTNPDPDIFDAKDVVYVATNWIESGLNVTIKTAP